MTKLESRFKRMFKCDSARISRPDKTMFLIIGFKRNTSQDDGVWTNENGVRKDWDYFQEQTIARGDTESELIADAKRYQKLAGMSMEQYLESLTK